MVRSAKKPRDDNAPKRPLSAYFLWIGENRDSYKTKNPDMHFTELMKQMASAWNDLSDAAKKPYIKSADKASESYKKKREKYMGSSAYKKHQEAVKEWKKSESNKPFHKDPNRPKKAASAYLLFVNAERPGLMKSGLSITEVTSAASKKWNNMGEGEKAKWEKKAAAGKAKYTKEIAIYEKSSKHKKYMAEKEAYDKKRKADRSASSGPSGKKVKRSTSRKSSVPRAPKRASKSRSRSAARRAA